MENFELLLPVIPEDYEKISIDGESFCDCEKYKDIIKVLYVKLNRNISKGVITPFVKKSFLLKILQKNNVYDILFHKKLKRCIPEGLDKNYICTDAEYEALKKEFDIN